MSQLKFSNGMQSRLVGVMRIFRSIRTNAASRDAAKPTTTSQSTNGSRETESTIGSFHSPSNIEKTILVWTNKFPNKEAVPSKVPLDTMQAAMSRLRIRVANTLMLLTIMGCAYIIITGKKHMKEISDSAEVNQNDYRRQITAEYKASLEKEAATK